MNKLDLWQVQLEQYPDSVQLDLHTLLSLPDTHTLDRIKRPMRTLEAMCMHQRDMAELRQQCWRWISLALSNAVEDTLGVFYVCCKNQDGSYKYLGYRYGVEGYQYLSGYPASDIHLPT